MQHKSNQQRKDNETVPTSSCRVLPDTQTILPTTNKRFPTHYQVYVNGKLVNTFSREVLSIIATYCVLMMPQE